MAKGKIKFELKKVEKPIKVKIFSKNNGSKYPKQTIRFDKFSNAKKFIIENDIKNAVITTF